jgi:hypothetical protein
LVSFAADAGYARGRHRSAGRFIDYATRWYLRVCLAYLVGLGPDTMTLAVGRPPRDLALATAIAGEHYAFCPDNVRQGVGSIREYARLLADQQLWPFWWD